MKTIILKFDRYELQDFFLASILYGVMVAVLIALLPAYTNTIIFYMSCMYLVVAFCVIAESFDGKKGYKTSVFFAFLVLFFVFAFRDGNAIDDRHYKSMLQLVAENGWFNQFIRLYGEPAYLIILQFISFFTDDYFWVQIVTAALPLLIMLKSFIDYRDYISSPVAIYAFITTFYFQMVSTNLSRMFFAISIVFYSIRYLINKELKKYFIAILFATLFHYSAIFMLIFAYLCIDKINKRFWTKFIYISVPVLFFVVGQFIAPMMGQKYNMYTEMGAASVSTLIGCLDTLPLVLIFLYFSQFIRGENGEVNSLYMIHSIYGSSIIIQISSLFFYLGRVSYYIDMVFIYGVGYIYKRITSPIMKSAFIALIVVYGIIYLYITQFSLSSHAEVLFPYENIFFSK